MGDLKNKGWIIAKGFMFLGITFLTALLIWAMTMDWKVLLLHGMGVWAACRFYYFAFYVIEKYVDGNYRFAGLFDFAKYWFGREP